MCLVGAAAAVHHLPGKRRAEATSPADTDVSLEPGG